jgi:hypothetical protein
MILNKSFRIRMDYQMNAALKKAVKQSGMTRDAFIRHAMRQGLGLQRKPPKLYLVP